MERAVVDPLSQRGQGFVDFVGAFATRWRSRNSPSASLAQGGVEVGADPSRRSSDLMSRRRCHLELLEMKPVRLSEVVPGIDSRKRREDLAVFVDASSLGS